MVQGSENSLDNFYQSFQSLRVLANKKHDENYSETLSKRTSPIRSAVDTLSPRNEHVSPKVAINLNSIKDNIHVLEREFVEFKDKMLSGLQLQSCTSQPRDELWTMVRQQRDEIRELHAALRELEEDNQGLRMELRNLKVFQHSEQLNAIDALRSELHDLKKNLTDLQAPSNPSTPASTKPPSTATATEREKQKSCIPQMAVQKDNPPHETKEPDPEIVLLCDSNGKFINMKRLFPSSKAVKIKTPRTSSALENIQKIKGMSLEHLIIHTGTNDFISIVSTGPRLATGAQTNNFIKPSYASVLTRPSVQDLSAQEFQIRELVTLLYNKLLC
ncbi:uncharacterized protein LOC121716833 [Alosa sapidissima]|nr:uncharacterized protein LOC121716833 [Alosa sapidissima]